MLAAGIAAYSVWSAAGVTGLVAMAGVAGFALVLVALLAVWDDGLVAGPAVLLLGYALSVGGSRAAAVWSAPLVAVALLGVVELAAWSLELRDGAEERPLLRVPLVLLSLLGGLLASSLVVIVGGAQIEGGPIVGVLGAAAALALVALIARLGSAEEGGEPHQRGWNP